MAKLFGIDIAGIVHRELSPGLLPGKLYLDVDGVRSGTNPTAGPQGGSVLTHKFKGLVQFYRDNEVDNELVLHKDRKIMIIANSLSPSTIPEKGMRIKMDDEEGTYQIVRVNRDPATATYLCQGRL